MSVLTSQVVSGSYPVFKPETRNSDLSRRSLLDSLDREILVLRHYEQLTDGAAAAGLDKSAASKRYTRAPVRLREIVAALPGEKSEEGS
jgi:hypothetical protein